MSTDAGASTSTSSDGAKNTAARLGLAPLGPLNVGSSSNSNSETATTATTGAVGANTSGRGHRPRSLPFLSPTRLPATAEPFTPEDFSLKASDMKLQTKLAVGAYGSVWKGTCAGKPYAIKVLTSVDIYHDKDWLPELTILKNYCQHPNLLSYGGAAKVRVTNDGTEDHDYVSDDEEEEGNEDGPGNRKTRNRPPPHGGVSTRTPPPSKSLYNIYILTGLASHGDLRHFWQTSPKLALDGPARGGWPLVIRLLDGAHKALTYLHSHNVIHRDIKTRNIVVNSRFEAQICDFGMARLDVNRVLGEEGLSPQATSPATPTPPRTTNITGRGGGGGSSNMSQRSRTVTPPASRPASRARRSGLKRQLSVVGTSEFMAPEIIFEEPYDLRCDTFSLGVVMAELLCRRVPRDRTNVGVLGSRGSSHVHESSDPSNSPSPTAVASQESSEGDQTPKSDHSDVIEATSSKWTSSAKKRGSTLKIRKLGGGVQGHESGSDWPSRPALKPFLSREPRRKFDIDQDEIVPVEGAPPGLLDLCVECIQYSPDDRIGTADLTEWLLELQESRGEEEKRDGK